ncbi:DoxX family protein [Rhodococcus sp. HNM0569]|uniref:DoxX family protein n=1 Tax=Rhodococcus sp. HNM0569 TaxID=2716340 RepID=UPI00146E5675|nr:DoxX family protein [Rhodococcus sp. HNM0569]NLU82660.1 DoxX family protein [Rhodococcus sp. HNM0569]
MTTTAQNRSAVQSVGILLARIGIGVVFLAHGLQKLRVWGQDGTAAAFEGMGVPAPSVSAFLATWLEIVGGAALILGVLVPVVGALFVLDMIGAFLYAHADSGIWIADGGYELVLALGAGSLLLASVGAGAFSVDALLRRIRS